jgi:hypothetical protein
VPINVTLRTGTCATGWTGNWSDAAACHPQSRARDAIVGLDSLALDKTPLSVFIKKQVRTCSDESPGDEVIDQLPAALTLTRDNWNPDAARQKDGVKPTPPEVPSGPFIRRVRGKGAEGIPAAPQRGLLLLYPLHPEESGIVELKDAKEPIIAFGVSFPSSNSAVKVEYAVDHLLWEQEYGAAD